MSAQPEPLTSHIPVPEPELTPREMIRRAEALRPLLRARQEATEAAGNMSAETNAELIKAGFYRVLPFYMMGVFKVVDGEIRIIDEIREILSFGATSGWMTA